MEAARDQPGPNEAPMQAQMSLVTAMICAQLKRSDEARQNLNSGEELTRRSWEQFDKLDKDFNERMWVETLTDSVLLREASRLVAQIQ